MSPRVQQLVQRGGTQWCLYDRHHNVLRSTFNWRESYKLYGMSRLHPGSYLVRYDATVTETTVCYNKRMS